MFSFRIPSYLVCDIFPRTDKIIYWNFTLKGHFSGKLIGLIMRYCWLTKEISVKFCWCSCNKQQKKILATTRLLSLRMTFTFLESVRLSFFFSPFSVVRPTQIFGIVKKNNNNDVVKPFFAWNNSFNLKNEYSITAQRTTGTKTWLFFTVYIVDKLLQATWGYEFYLRVLKVSLTSERSERVRDTFSTRR